MDWVSRPVSRAGQAAERMRQMLPTSSAPQLGDRERQFASILWQYAKAGRALGRRDIHRMTGVHPTLAGLAVTNLIDSGLFQEGSTLTALGRGRPQTVIQLDQARRVFLGLSIAPGEIRLARLNAAGTLLHGEIAHRDVKPGRLVHTAAKMLLENVNPSVFSVGITVTGVVDPAGHALLFSSALPSSSPISLESVYEAAGHTPILLNNDLHALASRWLLSIEASASNDASNIEVVLLVGVDDGRLAASVLVNGRPQPGSVVAANELGHARFPVETDRCFCGHTGCLERIVSSAQLSRLGAKTRRSLEQVLAEPGKDRKALVMLLDHLTGGLANSVNFVRPTRLVIASPLVRHSAFTDYLKNELPERFLPGLRGRVAITFWQQSSVQSAENAAWLALADVFGHPLNQLGATRT